MKPDFEEYHHEAIRTETCQFMPQFTTCNVQDWCRDRGCSNCVFHLYHSIQHLDRLMEIEPDEDTESNVQS